MASTTNFGLSFQSSLFDNQFDYNPNIERVINKLSNRTKKTTKTKSIKLKK